MNNQLTLQEAFEFQKEDSLDLFYNRVITIPITARTALKKELISTIGVDRTKGLFIRYGWHCGVDDAKKAMELHWVDIIDLINHGPKFHMLHGYLDHVEIVDLQIDKNGQLQLIEIIWTNSFEAVEFLKDGKYSEIGVCNTLCGYASGYLSTILNETIIVKESECTAMGHKVCRAVCMPKSKWGDSLNNEDKYYEENSLIKEFDEVNEKLIIERDYLKRANEIQKKLTHSLLSNQGIQRIVNILHNETGIPIMIEDQHNVSPILSSGVNFNFLKSSSSLIDTQLVEINSSLRALRTPIYFENKMRGYCSFVYTENEYPTELDYLLIDKMALVVATFFLNEFIKINTEQNIRRNLLNDILENRLQKDEISKISYYLKFPPNDHYWMLTLERKILSQNLEPDIELNELLISRVSTFLKELNINAIVSQKSNQIIILIQYETFKACHLTNEKFLNRLLVICNKRLENIDFYIGVSEVLSTIFEIPLLYDETLASLIIKKPNQKFYYYSDLEIESILFQIHNDSIIHQFVEKQIGVLLQVDKEFDLAKTLYSYIENGLNINHTAKVLSMSISGLRYRLSKISNILNLDLSDTKHLFSIYMALKILLVKDHFTF